MKKLKEGYDAIVRSRRKDGFDPVFRPGDTTVRRFNEFRSVVEGNPEYAKLPDSRVCFLPLAVVMDVSTAHKRLIARAFPDLAFIVTIKTVAGDIIDHSGAPRGQSCLFFQRQCW